MAACIRPAVAHRRTERTSQGRAVLARLLSQPENPFVFDPLPPPPLRPRAPHREREGSGLPHFDTPYPLCTLSPLHSVALVHAIARGIRGHACHSIGTDGGRLHQLSVSHTVSCAPSVCSVVASGASRFLFSGDRNWGGVYSMPLAICRLLFLFLILLFRLCRRHFAVAGTGWASSSSLRPLLALHRARKQAGPCRACKGRKLQAQPQCKLGLGHDRDLGSK